MWYDPIVKLLLRSPLHSLISGGVLLLTYTGPKTGKTFHVPLSYVRDGNDLLILTFKRRTWWRGLKGGTPVSVRLKGRDVEAVADPEAEDFERIKAGFAKYIENNAYLSKALDVPLDDDGKPDPETLESAAEGRVMVWIRLIHENKEDEIPVQE